ncbi:uncharacterized protein C11orf24 homolog [Misgurnus anguillicaudatus]|uniref:uncharacterized protein C11orf24 homolog n=1 Tax=Misgurnus anguillicaudatus TaxID=75329 RepID=UPI003CCFC2F3
MIPATHVIMATHPILVLLPILVFLVLPCASIHLDNGFRIVLNKTLQDVGKCELKLCPQNETCTKALIYGEKQLCFLIYCPPAQSCENITNVPDLLAYQESVHVGQNKISGSAPPHNSSGPTASLPSQDNPPNVTQQSIPKVTNISASNSSTPTKPPASSTVVPNQVQTTHLTQVHESGIVSPTTLPATPTTLPATSTATTTTTITSNATATSTTTTTTVITTTNATTHQPTTPSEPKKSASITPLVPKATPLMTSPKPVQTTPVPTSTKPSPTTPKTSRSPPTTPKNISDGAQGRTDRTKVEVAGDPLSVHLLNTSSLLAVLLFGLLFFVVAVALFLKQAYESYKRKDYTQVDYLINGMYSDSGV